MSLELLKKLDKDLLIISSGDGNILVSNHFQGRVFAEIGGRLLHRLVEDLAQYPDPVEFNNLGGNSLWPAPEGGAFAFNYPPKGGWMVQQGINSVKTITEMHTPEKVAVSKRISLMNRQGEVLDVGFNRIISAAASRFGHQDFDLQVTAYDSIDRLSIPCGIPTDKALISAWSLEQFPGAENVFAFGCCKGSAANALNLDFYGDPLPRLSYRDNFWGFRLGGANRLQIGVSAAADPLWIGAYSPDKNMVVLRSTCKRPDGRYFNIADNDQVNGAFSAGDMFSVFNGSQELDFHELETIAPVTILPDGTIGGSVLESHTSLFTGNNSELRRFLISLGVPSEMLGDK